MIELLWQSFIVIPWKLLACVMVAEMYAIMHALTCICHVHGKKFIIFSHFMSSLEALNGLKLESDPVQNITKGYTHPSYE